MSVKQTIQGKAFEYACLVSLYNQLIATQQEVVIENNNAYHTAKNCFNIIENQQNLLLGAEAAVRIILRLEPQLENPLNNKPLYLSIQADARGMVGDVRDLLCIRQQNQWEIGISCKHNHSAVKHSRLSSTIDFGDRWFNIPCSQSYFNAINPLFDELNDMTAKGMLWRNIRNKEDRFYVPLLMAFVAELQNLDIANPRQIPARLITYLLGINDFYKVIAIDNRRVTQIQAFSMYGTLNRPAGRNRPQVRIPQLQMPNIFHDISFKPRSKNTIIITCDHGWAISMRIHNARTKVEPSLKFDVKLVGIPPGLYTHHEPW